MQCCKKTIAEKMFRNQVKWERWAFKIFVSLLLLDLTLAWNYMHKNSEGLLAKLAFESGLQYLLCRTCVKYLGCSVAAAEYNTLWPHQRQNPINIGLAYDVALVARFPRKVLDCWVVAPRVWGVRVVVRLTYSGCRVLFLLGRCCALFQTRKWFAFSRGCWNQHNPPLMWVVGVVVVNERAFLREVLMSARLPQQHVYSFK